MKKEVKGILISIIFIFCLSLIFSGALAFNYTESIQEQDMSVEVSNRIYSEANDLRVNLSVFPQDDLRQRSSVITFPSAIADNNGIQFHFQDSGDLDFRVLSNVTTSFFLLNLNNIDLNEAKHSNSNLSYLSPYLRASNYSNSNNLLIINKALQLLDQANTNNSIEILYTLAEYVKNSMTYDLAYQDLKKASEILEDKRGVCAHYTILFIALTRAIGLPARYVSGVAYSNKNNDFEEHAWAEVYLPEYGWIPYDTTFGQYGWLDTSHVSLKKSIDAGEASIGYSYFGGYIQPDQIVINTNVIEQRGHIHKDIDIQIELYKEEVSSESYVPLKVRVKNNNDYYISVPIRLVSAPGVQGNSQKIILLAPLDEKEFYFIIHVPDIIGCRRGCVSPIEVSDIFDNKASINMTFSQEYEQISLEKAEMIASQGLIKRDIDFFCSPEKSIYNRTELERVNCSIRTDKQETLKICYKQECVEKSFYGSENLSFEIGKNVSSSCLTLKNLNISLNSCVDFMFEQKKQSFWQKIFQDILDFFNNLF